MKKLMAFAVHHGRHRDRHCRPRTGRSPGRPPTASSRTAPPAMTAAAIVRPQRITRNDRMWRGNDGRYYCKRDNGTTGLVIGAGVGALAGHHPGRGDRTLGAILGGAVGAGGTRNRPREPRPLSSRASLRQGALSLRADRRRRAFLCAPPR